MLEWFAEAPDPDAGLFGFRRLSESLGRTPWYLKTLRDEGQVAERLAKLLATSRYATALLEREPQGVRMLGEDLQPLLARRPLTEEMLAAGRRRDDAEKAVRAIRGVRRRELFRIAAGDLLGLTDVADVGAGLSRLTDATLEATLRGGDRRRSPQARGPRRRADPDGDRRDGPLRRVRAVLRQRRRRAVRARAPRTGVDQHEATSYAQAVANELRRLLAAARAATRRSRSTPTCAPRASRGRWSRSLDSYAAYYAKWSKVWEAQALLRADAVVGDPDLRRRFEELIDPLRYPAAGISDDDVVEVRRIKARVDKERLPRGADPKSHLKLGRGGLADIEWTVQLLQMRHAGDGARAAHPAHARGAGRRPRGGAARPSRTPTSLVDGWRVGEPGAQRDHAGARLGQPTSCRTTSASAPRSRRPRLPGRRHRRDGQRPPADRCGSRAPSWTGCSGNDAAAPRRPRRPLRSPADAAGAPAGGARPRWPAPGPPAGAAPGSRCRPAPARRWSGW